MSTGTTAGHLDVDVAIVGAGFAGIGMATHLARRGNESFMVLERADAVGGTWRDNIYPGIACDIPAHLYSFSFRPPADWSSIYPSGAEIRDYLELAAAEEGLLPHIRFGAELDGAVWDSGSACWHLTVSGAGGEHRIDAKVLVLAVGRLSEPKIPDTIDGLDTFPGPVVHTAGWRDDLPLAGSRIGVVGTGASAVQLVPELAAVADEVVVFSRTAPYVVPRDDRLLDADERAALLDPETAARRRDELLHNADQAFRQRLGLHPDIDEIRDRARGHLERQVPDPVLRAQLTPDYEIGCKRILLSDDFYPALLRDNVVFEPNALSTVVESKACAAGGATYDLDMIVMATGFEAARPPVSRHVSGRGGELLSDHWSHGMTSYASTVVAGFPNMFVLDGPNAALGHNSAIYMIETQLDYVIGALDHMAADGVRSLEVSADAEAGYTREIDERSAQTVWMAGCNSWYLDPASGRLTLLWPGTAASFRARNGTFEPGPFEFDPVTPESVNEGS
ncbi:NAD(P)/FAD-dependent oxidoreductase [Gordonia sp. NB41Y]|uniref:flavin-containing monooxygenase n=1 Tax=Gordonia sp. NB41Y TaxID=875808 RepID=UPI0006B1F007|nr:NAD(P)/FAD-dependent oxidoreductase [Gordonia sp. NB41Y]EMP14979.2 4-hydroxyacetophenone monooxygenase [Gordonia sp. NB41Y]WLP90023.1 NAD(P)/FAD-dependent oxidoreductase [Gordonia sp. NB41Y]